MNSFFTRKITKSCLRIFGILFLANIEITLVLIFLLIVQNNFTKNNVLNIYSSGLFFNYNQTKEIIEILTQVLIMYFLVYSIQFNF